MISYGKQSITKEDIDSVIDVLKSDFLTCGPKVEEFERDFSKKVGSRYAVAVSNGTAALHLACLAAGLKHGDELITSPITFAASANCALYCGARPVFVDINDKGLIDENLIEKSITRNTKILIPVHLTGLPCNLEKIGEIAKKHDLIVIEDACHALGARYKDTKIGDCSYSDMAMFSFHPVKHITTGEGGMITTNDVDLYNKIRTLRTHGITKQNMKHPDGLWSQEMQMLGYNYRLSDIHSALGISQLKRLDEFVRRRRYIARRYDEAFTSNPEIEIIKDDDDSNSYHLYIIILKDKKKRLDMYEHLRKNDIICQVHYPPVYYHPYYEKLGYEKGMCINSQNFYERILSIPIYPTLTDEEQDNIIRLINQKTGKISA